MELSTGSSVTATESIDKKKEEEKKEEEKKPEDNFEILHNPARVTPAQLKYITFDVDERYTPIKRGEVYRIVILKDNKPGAPEELAGTTTSTSTPTTTKAKPPPTVEEPEPPAPMEFTQP